MYGLRAWTILICNGCVLQLMFVEGSLEGVGWGCRMIFLWCMMRSYCMFVCQRLDLRCGLSRLDFWLCHEFELHVLLGEGTFEGAGWRSILRFLIVLNAFVLHACLLRVRFEVWIEQVGQVWFATRSHSMCCLLRECLMAWAEDVQHADIPTYK